MLRVKNEEQKILYCLKSIIDIFDEIIFVDNGSEDSTLDLVTKFKKDYDKEEKIKIFHYPWKIARCGAEHLATAENSVHSLAYYYNWTLSHCSYKYVCKWDGDMVVRKECRQEFESFLKNQVLKDPWKCWILTGQMLYRSLDKRYLLSQRLLWERRLFPLSYRNRFYKEERWEVLRCIPPLPVGKLAEVSFYELKFANENELSHWSPQTLAEAKNSDELKQDVERFQLIKQARYQDDQFTLLSSNFLDEQISNIQPLYNSVTCETENKYSTEGLV